MAARKHYQITKVVIVPVPNQFDPDGNPAPDEWRVNIHREVTVDDVDDPDFDRVVTSDVLTFKRSDPWGVADDPEIRSVCECVFHEESEGFVHHRERPARMAPNPRKNRS